MCRNAVSRRKSTPTTGWLPRHHAFMPSAATPGWTPFPWRIGVRPMAAGAPSAVRGSVRRGARCAFEQPPVPAASCASSFAASRAALAGFAAPYAVFGTATEHVRVGDQGARFTFRFCPVCGTTLFRTEEGCEHRSVAVAVGAFADPGFPPPQESVHDCRRHPWVRLPPGIWRHDKDPT
jgi:hypothetical protein